MFWVGGEENRGRSGSGGGRPLPYPILSPRPGSFIWDILGHAWTLAGIDLSSPIGQAVALHELRRKNPQDTSSLLLMDAGYSGSHAASALVRNGLP